MADLFGTLPPELALEQQRLNRQQKMAEMLLAQGGQPQAAGQMVSGRYVPNSFFQNLQGPVNMMLGAYMANQGDKAALDLAKQLREAQTKMGEQYFEAMSPTQTELAGPTPTGTPLTTVNQPDYRKAFSIATDPYAPKWLQAQAAEMLKPRTVKEGETVSQLNLATNKYEPMATGGMSLPSDVKSAAVRVGLDPSKAATWGPNEINLINNRIEADKRAGKTDISLNLGQKEFDNTLKLRSDFRSEPVYKGFQEIESAYSQINKSLDQRTAAGDLAASTKLMKLLDPTSVVRESELAMAMRATGKLDQLYNYANQIATGQFLNPTQVKEFRALAKEFYTTAYDQYNAKRDEYVGIAERNKLNVEDVVGKPPKAVVVEQPPKYAVNPTTKERIVSTDGGVTWKPVPKAK